VPTLTNLSPTSAFQNDVVGITITGTGFAPGATVQVSGSGISVASVTVVNTNTVTAVFTINGSASVGPRAVTVTNSAPGGGVSNDLVFTVMPVPNPIPVLTSI